MAAQTKQKSEIFKKMMEDKYCNGNLVNGGEGSIAGLSAEEFSQKMQAQYVSYSISEE